MTFFKYIVPALVVFLVASKGVVAKETSEKCDDLDHQWVTKSIGTVNGLVTTLTDHVVDLKISLADMKVEMDQLKKENSEMSASLKVAHWYIQDNAEIQKGLKSSFEVTKKEVEHTKTGIVNLNTSVAKLETQILKTQKDVENSKKGISKVESSVVKTNSKIDKIDKMVVIIGETGASSCQKVCAGSTARGKTNWAQHGSRGITSLVDISQCDFISAPTITTAIEGSGHHWTATGTSAVYNAGAKNFRIYLYHSSSITTATANARKWNVEWIAVGRTC